MLIPLIGLAIYFGLVTLHAFGVTPASLLVLCIILALAEWFAGDRK